jgi:hypothetical protein
MYRRDHIPPAGPAVAQAAQPDQPHVAAPAGGLAGAVQSTDHRPTYDMLDGAVVSNGAPDQRLDVGAALGQGRGLFSLQARYQAGDYDLAGPQGVSHQPLSQRGDSGAHARIGKDRLRAD